MRATQRWGTDNVPIEAPTPSPNAVGPSPECLRLTAAVDTTDLRSIAALFNEFRFLIATADGGDSELRIDSEVVAGNRWTSNVVRGDEDNARITFGSVWTTCWPADMTSGADFSAHDERRSCSH